MATPAALLGHGGRLGAARAAWPDAPTPWLDLSTGINPRPYPVAAVPQGAWTRLPDPEALGALERAAAAAFSVEDPDRVVAAAGSEALIRLLPRLLAARRIAISSRTYGGHAQAWRAADAEIVALDDPAADLRVLVNPDNPSGRALPPDQVLGLTDGPLLVDEAFVETVPDLSVAALAGTAGREDLMVLRSFGKFHGLAGVRLGFLVGRPSVAAAVREALGDWPVSGPAIAAGLAAYADRAWSRRTRQNLARAAARLDSLLSRAGFEIAGGTTLFRLARAADARRRFEALARAGILARPFAWDETLIRFGLPGPEPDWLRLEDALESLR